jgi:hypothetical protein
MSQDKAHTAVLGIAWYRREEWEDLKAYCEDRETMEDSYDDWKREATKALHEFQQSGEHAEAVDFNLHEFQKWCTAHNKLPNASSRSEFTAVRLQELHRSKPQP